MILKMDPDELITIRVQYLADTDPYNCVSMYPIPARAPTYSFALTAPLATQLGAILRLLGAPQRVRIWNYNIFTWFFFEIFLHFSGFCFGFFSLYLHVSVLFYIFIKAHSFLFNACESFHFDCIARQAISVVVYVVALAFRHFVKFEMNADSFSVDHMHFIWVNNRRDIMNIQEVHAICRRQMVRIATW